MADSLDKAAFLELVAPGFAEQARREAESAIERTHAIREMPDVMDRVLTVWKIAVQVWGDENRAVDFLFRNHAMLEDQRPVDVLLASQNGAARVQDILGGLRYGSAA